MGQDDERVGDRSGAGTIDAVIASSNAGKAAELREIFAGSALILRPPAELGLQALDIPETGRTYRRNALLKARAYATQYSMPALGDDSGLAVRGLGWRPGLHTARFGGPGLSAAERVDLLLREMEGMRGVEREARFYCVLILAWPDGRVAEGRGLCSGTIAPAPRGRGGFGYDPVFFVPSRGVTAAELPPDTKNALSHRGRAARNLLRALARANETGPVARRG